MVPVILLSEGLLLSRVGEGAVVVVVVVCVFVTTLVTELTSSLQEVRAHHHRLGRMCPQPPSTRSSSYL